MVNPVRRSAHRRTPVLTTAMHRRTTRTRLPVGQYVPSSGGTGHSRRGATTATSTGSISSASSPIHPMPQVVIHLFLNSTCHAFRVTAGRPRCACWGDDERCSAGSRMVAGIGRQLVSATATDCSGDNPSVEQDRHRVRHLLCLLRDRSDQNGCVRYLHDHRRKQTGLDEHGDRPVRCGGLHGYGFPTNLKPVMSRPPRGDRPTRGPGPSSDTDQDATSGSLPNRSTQEHHDHAQGRRTYEH